MLDGLSDIHRYSQVSIDARHRRMLAELAVACKAKHVLEIGCAEGYSTAAWAWLLRHGHIQRLTLCDIHFQASVNELCVGLPVKIFAGRSADLLPTMADDPPDFVFVDGDHRTDAVAEEMPLIHALGVPVISAHDTSYWKMDDLRYEPGARQYKWFYQSLPGWWVLEDAYHRENEQTQRGLMFATRVAGYYAEAQKIFKGNAP